MSNEQIIRAWRDKAYRSSLSETEKALLPQHPAGYVELAEAELGFVPGGEEVPTWLSFATCPTCLIQCNTQRFLTLNCCGQSVI